MDKKSSTKTTKQEKTDKIGALLKESQRRTAQSLSINVYSFVSCFIFLFNNYGGCLMLHVPSNLLLFVLKHINSIMNLMQNA